jgi:hypothetical protein
VYGCFLWFLCCVGAVKVSIVVYYVHVEGIIRTLMLRIFIILTEHCGICLIKLELPESKDRFRYCGIVWYKESCVCQCIVLGICACCVIQLKETLVYCCIWMG